RGSAGTTLDVPAVPFSAVLPRTERSSAPDAFSEIGGRAGSPGASRPPSPGSGTLVNNVNATAAATRATTVQTPHARRWMRRVRRPDASTNTGRAAACWGMIRHSRRARDGRRNRPKRINQPGLRDQHLGLRPAVAWPHGGDVDHDR